MLMLSVTSASSYGPGVSLQLVSSKNHNTSSISASTLSSHRVELESDVVSSREDRKSSDVSPNETVFSVSSELLMHAFTRFPCGEELQSKLISSMMSKSGELDLQKPLLLFSLFISCSLLSSDEMSVGRAD